LIRKAVKEDIENILSIENELYDQPWSYDNFLCELERDITEFLVYDENRIKGYLIYWKIFNDENKRNELEVLNIAVSKNHQSQGIGRSLMKYMLENTPKPFICFLDVRVDNLPAINLYKSLGFHITGKRKNFYGFNKDAYTMTLNSEVEYDQV